jgi:RNA polymerase sigma factor (sigma-70 family)
MEHLRTIGLLDSDGRPFHPRIERVLSQLFSRLRREFPALQDEVILAEVMEEAGRRIRAREQRGGAVERLHGYAWVTIRSVATSRMRLGSTRLLQRTLEAEAANARLLTTPSTVGTAEDIERKLLLQELLSKLSREERLICLWKQAGFSSQEIADHQGRSVESVNTMFSRAKQKIRCAIGIGRDNGESRNGSATS